ncbi:MAG TPA: acetate--CoA ligase family protein [Solirubrobacteraceae bacterium]|nr:acetate--CoA ligase family protein [Solirubrobacteraceae bacterium]
MAGRGEMCDAPPLRHLLEASSVAVVGASGRPGSVGANVLAGLLERGFAGRVYPVNPRYEQLHGRRCLRSLTEVPEQVDLVVIAVANAKLEEQLELAAQAGARAAVIFASAFEEVRDGESGLTERLGQIARRGGMTLCGPNCMGFVNAAARLQVCGYPLPVKDPGSIALISHSGSSFSALLHNNRDLRFNLAVSSGLELVTTASDYLRYAVDLDGTRVVGLILEQIRDPEGFAATMASAHERDIAVVVLKVGRDPRAADMVATHSGAVAGDDGAYEAFFEAHGIHRVRDLPELADTLELFAAPRRAVRGGLGAVTDSGGERSLLVDLAPGVELPEPSAPTKAALKAILDPGLAPVNPVDAWGTGADATQVFVQSLRCLHDDDAIGAVALVVDLTGRSFERYVKVAIEVAGITTKPFAVLVPYPGGMNLDAATEIRGRGVPVLEGMASGLAAVAHLFAHRDFQDRPPLQPRAPTNRARRTRWRKRLATQAAPGEATALELLSDWGIPVAATITAGSEDDALAAAHEIGWPVALKTAQPGGAHKADVHGVFLGLGEPAQLRAAYRSCASRLGPAVNVQAMAPSGVELALGIVHDQDFGPLLVIAAGGTLVELIGDRRLALAPVDRQAALRLIDRLKIRPLLDGYRGEPAADIDALARAIASLSELAEDLSGSIEALDVNPLIVTPSGCLAVDARVVPARPG